MTTSPIREKRFVRTLVLSAALLMASVGGIAGIEPAAADVLNPRVDTGGSGGGGGSASGELPEWAQTQNERSIALIESLNPTGELAGWDDIEGETITVIPTNPF